MPKKHTLEHVQETFKSKGFVLVSKEYIPDSILEYVCENGHTLLKRFNKFMIRPICKECNKEATKAKNEEKKQARALLPKPSLKGIPKKFNVEFVKSYMEEQGCKLLSTAYTSDREKLKFVCICGKEAKQNFNAFYHAKSRCNNQECIQQRMKKAMVTKYGVSNSMHSDTIKTKLAETNKKKYGVENVFASDIIKEKIRCTNRQKYGVESAAQNSEIKNKMKKTNLERYGSENPFASSIVQKKMKLDNLNKYGVEWTGQRLDVKRKIRQTFLDKYGVTCPINAPEIKKRIKKRCLEEYGVEHHAQREDVIERRKKTNVKRYGVEQVLSSSTIRAKINKTIMTKYGVTNPFLNPMIRAKINETMLKRYGCKSALQNLEVYKRLALTNIKRYGMSSLFKHPIIRAKARFTNLSKYGVEHVMQNAEIAEKAANTSRKFKNYILPSGKVIKIQGYEDIVLNELLTAYTEEKIVTTRSAMPEIWYIDNNGQYHRYFPDMYIPCDNKVVEVKSVYTYQQNKEMFHKKRKACLCLGFEFESYILDHKHNRLYMHI
jgi:hypothetical protein